MHSESRNVFSVASMCPDYASLLGALVLCCVADNELNPFHVLQMLYYFELLNKQASRRLV